MSAILDAAKTQFRDRLGSGLQSVDVPEWTDATGNAFVIWFKPSLNLRQQQKILALSSQDKAAEAVAQTLILRALDADGKPLFRQADMTEIMRETDPDVIGRIVTAMSADDISDAELEKN